MFSRFLAYGLLAWSLFGSVAATAQSVGLQRPAAPHYDVVALRVEFQPDTTRFTTGDGTFGGVLYPDGLQPTVDPLPHDAAYFQAHLDFLADYVAKVSDGQTQVTAHLVPEVVRLSKPMGAYSPTGFEADSDPERAKLVALIDEAWTTASAVSAFDLSGFDPQRTAFLIFHAGVGRDIELLGTVLDKTPQDLPSISFSERELVRLGGGEIVFNGMPVRQTLLLPRTETRSAFNFVDDTAFLLELSINGLLAASFFNYLGVPDLFNTETGDSGIGPFGLMDPLGIFAYNGLFPPEPMAWTRYFLGWVTPQELEGDGPETVRLRAAGLPSPSRIARVPISSTEYFLVENRNRDPEGDGVVLRVWQRGEIVEQHLPREDDTFNRFNIDGFVGGVVVGVDNYDFALPGLDADDNQFAGGILVWHVDERILAEKLDTGGVNADPERRAVDLEEADSAQDLGAPNSLGAPFDFFFEGNPVRVALPSGTEIRFYENRFGPETIPNSHSNEGGPSFIVLEDFSAPDPVMSFVYRREAEAGITSLDVAPPTLRQAVRTLRANFFEGSALGATENVVLVYGIDPSTDFDNWLFLLTYGLDGSAYAAKADDEAVIATGSITKPVVGGTNSYATLHSSTPPGSGYTLQFTDVTFPGGGSSVFTPSGKITLPAEVNDLIALPPVMRVLEGEEPVYYGLFTGPRRSFVVRMEGEGAVSLLDPGDIGDPLHLGAVGRGQVAVVGNRATRVIGTEQQWRYSLSEGGEPGQVAFGRDKGGLLGVLPVPGAGELILLLPDGTTRPIELATYASMLTGEEARLSVYPVLVDLDEDGRLDVLTTYGVNLVAFTQNGALVRDFPIRLAAPSVAQPLVAELTESGQWSVIVASTNGFLYAYDVGEGGRRVPGFPLAVGPSIEAAPVLQGSTLMATTTGGTLRGWRLDNLGAVWWSQLYANGQNQSYVELTDTPEPQPGSPTGGLIVEAETYNWPNPIREGQTFLRCMTTEDASVRITIIDAAGSLIDDVTLELRGGAPAEHLWQTSAASGLYYARVTATSVSGQRASKLIKMAIIR